MAGKRQVGFFDYDPDNILGNLFKDIFSMGDTKVTVTNKGIGKVSDTLVGNRAEIDMPGTRREDVKVTVAGGQISVTWKDRHGNDRKTGYIISAEYDDVTARLADGVLTVELKLRETGVREIPVL